MTSSERHLDRLQPRWNYNIQRYKPNRDVFFEKGLFSIVFLAHGRPDVTRKCLLATLESIKLYDGEVEWIFVENAGDEENDALFRQLDVERKTIIRTKNYGINHGLNQGWAVSRGEWVMIHENDWQSTRNSNFLKVAKSIFQEKEDVGIIQLRDPFDPNENFGYGKPEYNPWSCTQKQLDSKFYSISREKTVDGDEYFVCKYPNGFNNNPVIIRKELYRKCGPYPEPEMGTDPRHGETEYQERVAKLDVSTAYIGIPMYWHSGKIQTKGL